jgi:hypothetical protein
LRCWSSVSPCSGAHSSWNCDNARLAEAIEAEHGNGPRVAAVDQSHAVMGEPEATLAHIFAMRQLLRPNQTGQFDQAVVKALTDDAR